MLSVVLITKYYIRQIVLITLSNDRCQQKILLLFPSFVNKTIRAISLELYSCNFIGLYNFLSSITLFQFTFFYFSFSFFFLLFLFFNLVHCIYLFLDFVINSTTVHIRLFYTNQYFISFRITLITQKMLFKEDNSTYRKRYISIYHSRPSQIRYINCFSTCKIVSHIIFSQFIISANVYASAKLS